MVINVAGTHRAAGNSLRRIGKIADCANGWQGAADSIRVIRVIRLLAAANQLSDFKRLCSVVVLKPGDGDVALRFG